MTQAHDDQIICGEGYGPGGVAVIVTCREPSVALAHAVRAGFAACGGLSGATGSVAYLFHPVGVLEFSAHTPPSKLRNFAFEAGAEDVVKRADGSHHVLTDPAEMVQVRARIARRGCQPELVRFERRSATRTRLDATQSARLQWLLQQLQAIPGVTHVYSNAEIPALLA